MRQIDYEYTNLPIPGGGYVTGFTFAENAKNLLYIRTDIGGIYRFNYEDRSWKALNEDVTMNDLSRVFPSALAAKGDSLFAISGMYQREGKTPKRCGVFSVSNDRGDSFTDKKTPFFVHGNLNGRGSGTRLVIDNSFSGRFYYASQRDGLFRTDDFGDSWVKLDVNGEDYMTFVWVSEDGKTIIVGTAGIGNICGDMRGHSLYISYDEGKSFQKLDEPEAEVIEGVKLNGYVAHRYYYDGRYFYCTMNVTGKTAYEVRLGYSCDCGSVTHGIIVRYEFGCDGKIAGYKLITPRFFRENGQDIPIFDTGFGYGGIFGNNLRPGLLAAATICRKPEGLTREELLRDANRCDALLISMDYGETWRRALYNLEIGRIDFQTSYMKPEYNGGRSLIHWMSDVKINPHNPDELWFNTGTGVFRSENFTDAMIDSKDVADDRGAVFHDECRGIEETVHINVYSPISGPVKVLDLVGDLGGFAFTKLDEACENSFSDESGNRYITCINADYSDIHPETIVVAARGNWAGRTLGGLIISHDYGLHFDRIKSPFGISEYLDARLHRIEQPNVNPGWVSMSPDTNNIIFCVADSMDLFMKGIVVSHNAGKSFEKVRIWSREGVELSFSDLRMKVYSDRNDSSVFYGFGDEFKVYVSVDGGTNFKECTGYEYNGKNHDFSGIIFGKIDCSDKYDIKPENGKSGIFYGAFLYQGLWKIHIDTNSYCVTMIKLTDENDIVCRVGLGLISPGADYLNSNKALYVCATIDGRYGFFRSFDDGKTWDKINKDNQNFGIIQCIDGDSRCFGNFVIATGSFGLKYGRAPLD